MYVEVFYLDVAYVCYSFIGIFKRVPNVFRCFRLILQVFHLDIAKVDIDVAYVAMVVHACFKRIFLVFYLFQTYVANVSS
jgi:hypothetical protein